MNGITYRELDRVLRSLGLTCRVLQQEPAARWYEHPETGAIVSLPLLPEDEPVFPNHLAAVRATLDIYGIADPRELAAELQKTS
ncbi:MAG TPA: hypothetical protein VFF52_03975 [Isosphaeraceae bacterium]|nr:hypothetical protein [Isosphaeraceae bacterium]